MLDTAGTGANSRASLPAEILRWLARITAAHVACGMNTRMPVEHLLVNVKGVFFLSSPHAWSEAQAPATCCKRPSPRRVDSVSIWRSQPEHVPQQTWIKRWMMSIWIPLELPYIEFDGDIWWHSMSLSGIEHCRFIPTNSEHVSSLSLRQTWFVASRTMLTVKHDLKRCWNLLIRTQFPNIKINTIY